MDSTNISIIQKSVNTIHELNINESIRLREEADFLENTRLYNAEKKGRANERADMIRKMKANGIPESQIQTILNS